MDTALLTMLMNVVAEAAPSSLDAFGEWVPIVSNASGWVVLVVGLFTRKLVVGSLYDDKVKEEELGRDTNEKLRERLDLMERSVSDLNEGQKTVIHVVESIKDGARRRSS